MRRIQVLRGAELDASAVSAWYEKQGADLGERFRVALDDAAHLIAELPGAGHTWPGRPNTRRISIKGFPYWLIYEETDMTVTLFAVRHFSRGDY